MQFLHFTISRFLELKEFQELLENKKKTFDKREYREYQDKFINLLVESYRTAKNQTA
jgi:hypothetical protein